MKSVLYILIALVIVAGIYFYVQRNGQKDDESIKIGVIIPITGSGADQGEWVKRGLELAVDEINKDKRHKLDLIFEDSKGEPKEAVSIYKKLRAINKIPIVITWGSGVGIALTPLVNQDGVIQMGVATAAPDYSTPGDFTFRNFPSAIQEAKYLSSALIKNLNKDKDAVAIIKINNDYGVGVADAFKKNYQREGGYILVEETFEPNAVDFRTLLTKIKNFNPKIIYLATYPKEGALLIKQARDLSIGSQFIASVAILGSKELFNLTGNAIDGLIVISPLSFQNSSDAFGNRFFNKFREKLEPQNFYSIRSYDALMVISFVIEECKKLDTECFKRGLLKVKNYPGVGGNITFDANGDVLSDFTLIKVKNGRFVEL